MAVSKASPTFHLYLDDTGTRHLDRAGDNRHPAWFALGGIIVAAEDEEACKELYEGLYKAWPKMTGPLHLTDMLSMRQKFSWIEQLSTVERGRFWAEYRDFLVKLPVIGAACVVHRPGYHARGYGGRAGDARWDLCRTAFNILVERSAKLALRDGRRLRVRFEGSDVKTDQLMRGYWALLKAGHGLMFDQQRAAKYEPLDSAAMVGSLIDLERKSKSSRLMQIADSYVYAMSRGRYDPNFDLFRALNEAGKLSDHAAGDAADKLGVKDSCFDGI